MGQKPNNLKLKFWEVAPADTGRHPSMTPFVRLRLDRNLTVGEMAERMGWEASDYADLEYGHMNASPETILKFCHAVNCHPLDLYSPKADPEMPLPREIFYSLVGMVEKPGFSDQDRVRSLHRLDTERRRAKAMVLENRKYLMPFLTAVGYGPNLRTYNAPLYDSSKDEEDIGTRALMERSLIEYQLLLESDRDTHQAIHERASRVLRITEKIMVRKAVALFGAKKAHTAIAMMTELLEQSPDKRELYRQFKRTPAIVGTIVQNADDYNPTQVLANKRFFFQAVKRHMEQVPLVDTMEDNVRQADARIRKFVNWWNDEKTARLLDWFEDYEVLKDFKDTPESAERKDLRPGAHPMPG